MQGRGEASSKEICEELSLKKIRMKFPVSKTRPFPFMKVSTTKMFFLSSSAVAALYRNCLLLKLGNVLLL